MGGTLAIFPVLRMADHRANSSGDAGRGLTRVSDTHCAPVRMAANTAYRGLLPLWHGTRPNEGPREQQRRRCPRHPVWFGHTISSAGAGRSPCVSSRWPHPGPFGHAAGRAPCQFGGGTPQ